MAITIGIVEDHSEFRQSLVYLISSFTDFSVAFACTSAEETLANTAEPDILLLDINLPGLSGIEAIHLFKQKWPDQKIIMLTILEDDHHILEAIKNGADGYILKKTNPKNIMEAIQQVYDGGAALTPMVARFPKARIAVRAYCPRKRDSFDHYPGPYQRPNRTAFVYQCTNGAQPY